MPYLTPMLLSLFLAAVLSPAVSNATPAAPTVRKVLVEGNSRISAVAVLRQLSVVPNSPLDPRKTREDLQKLYSLGVFEKVQVTSREAADGQVDIVYGVREKPFVSSFSVEGVDSKLEEQIRETLRKQKLELQAATPFNPAVANKAALTARNFLRSKKYPNADVQVLTQKSGNSVRVSLSVRQGRKLEIGSVRFTGNKSISADELVKQMQFARPAHFWARWAGAARYVPEELESDLQRIRTYYRARGFAAASTGEPRIRATGVDSKQRIEIEIPIVEGERYRLTSVKMEGHVKTGAEDVEKILGALKTPGSYDYSLLESTRQRIMDTLGHYGYALARVELKQVPNENDRTIQVVYKVDAGDPVAIGRIQFSGNKRLPDKFLRRELKSREGEIFDTLKLDKSVERLNKSNLVQEVHRSDVALELNERTNLLDITFSVKEKERQGIYLTGGTGGINGGYLGILYTAFNFFHLGETLSMQLDGGASQSNMLLNIVGTRFLGSPFSIGLAIFNKYAGFNVANVVPGPESLVRVLRRRSRGIGLSGAYPVTGNLQVGTGFETLNDSVTGVPNSSTGGSLRSALSPFVLFDRTRGVGPETRGTRLSYSHSFDGSLFLKSLDSTGSSFQFTHYAGDPFTKGRNYFAFNLSGSWVRPSGGGPLLMERRYYPGDEIVRGFSRGALSPWASVPDNSSPQPSGADSVIGFSTEYRVPIKGALSGVGFFDIGWTHLNPEEAAQMGMGARLIDASNGVFRASLGGELRVQLPIIRQPARLIFSWNPLRLNAIVRDPSSVLQLADPKTSIRFALGGLF